MKVMKKKELIAKPKLFSCCVVSVEAATASSSGLERPETREIELFCCNSLI